MTENEAKRPKIAIIGGGRNTGRTLKAHIELLEELESYRAIGTVEEIQQKLAELDRWHTNEVNANIKNVFANTSTSICHNCDHKDEYIEELEAENAEYKSIGTIEECRVAVERMKNIQSVIESVRETCYQMGLDESQAEILTDGIKEKLDWSE